LQEIVGRIDFLKGGKNLKHLSSGQKVTKIDLPEDGILLVRDPHRRQLILPAVAMVSLSYVLLQLQLNMFEQKAPPEIGDRVLSSELFQQYQAIFINVASWDGFRRSDLRSNKLRLLDSPPNFVVEFRQKLDTKPALSPDVRESFLSSFSLPPDQGLDVRYFLYLPVCVPFLMVSVGE